MSLGELISHLICPNTGSSISMSVVRREAQGNVLMWSNESQCFVIIRLISSSKKLKGIYCLQMAALLQHTTISVSTLHDKKTVIIHN